MTDLILAVVISTFAGIAAFCFAYLYAIGICALADRCTCSKGAWDAACPKHGKERIEW